MIGLYLVADGMGGHGDGEVASRITADTVGALLIQNVVLPILQGQTLSTETLTKLIDGAIQIANQGICKNAQRRQ